MDLLIWRAHHHYLSVPAVVPNGTVEPDGIGIIDHNVEGLFLYCLTQLSQDQITLAFA